MIASKPLHLPRYYMMGILGMVLLVACSPSVTHNMVEAPSQNSAAAMEKPYLILISLDGFRWDYVDLYEPPNLTAFIENGAQAESLIPSFPSKTFPNHYTIATGMYPDHHGLLSNTFYSYDKDVVYNIGDRELVEDGFFYGGSPIWVEAAKAGMVTASFFFVGSEADVKGMRPNHYFQYDGRIPNSFRVEQVLDWLAMPDASRPHMITMYFSDTDNAGHQYGPNNHEMMEQTVLSVDTVLGQLFEGVAATGLPVNMIIVSDHGMMEVPSDHYIAIEKIENDDLYRTVNSGAIVSIHPHNPEYLEASMDYLKERAEHFKVYETKNTPEFEFEQKNRNWGSIQVVPDIGYYFSSVRSIGVSESRGRTTSGQHGFDPNSKEMHGIFYANGPAIKKGAQGESVKNIHVYPLMCEILGLSIPDNIDGKLGPLNFALAE